MPVVVVLLVVVVIVWRLRARAARRNDVGDGLAGLLGRDESYRGKRWPDSERPWL